MTFSRLAVPTALGNRASRSRGREQCHSLRELWLETLPQACSGPGDNRCSKGPEPSVSPVRPDQGQFACQPTRASFQPDEGWLGPDSMRWARTGRGSWLGGASAPTAGRSSPGSAACWSTGGNQGTLQRGPSGNVALSWMTLSPHASGPAGSLADRPSEIGRQILASGRQAMRIVGTRPDHRMAWLSIAWVRAADGGATDPCSSVCARGPATVPVESGTTGSATRPLKADKARHGDDRISWPGPRCLTRSWCPGPVASAPGVATGLSDTDRLSFGRLDCHATGFRGPNVLALFGTNVD